MNMDIKGLTTEEVQERMAGRSDDRSKSITKTRGQIYKENILTLFNLLNFTIAALLFIAGAYTNMLFIAIIITNIAVGISQGLKAKKLVDELSLLNRPVVTVIRDGVNCEITPEKVVKDDIVVLGSGRQIVNDAVVVSGSMEVNESLLTGESDGVVKEVGSELLSGSSVISGKCYARVTHVGGDNYANRLADEVKKEKQVCSELLGSMRRVTKFTSFLIVPLGILLFIEAMLVRGAAFDTAVVSSSAALLGMLPKGLVLLISVSLANGVIRLSKQKILVQNIYALETLAHVDVVCLDKTGTLTDGRLSVHETEWFKEYPGEEKAQELLTAYLGASEDNNATIEALRSHTAGCNMSGSVRKASEYKVTGLTPFSSKRKWGAVSFEGEGTVFIGAPDRLPSSGNQSIADKYLSSGYRVIAVCHAQGQWAGADRLPEGLNPLCVIALEDNIRKNAKKTLKYFYDEGVDVKVISGDHVKTVSMVAKKAGLRRWNNAIDMSRLAENVDYDSLCEKFAVFARVTPRQKQELVRALKRRGHKVAMTGDGVNDLLALREADCSIAVAEGSDASRQISQIVLLESDFTHLPQVVLEGRKVVNNVTRTAGVFFIKTIYSVLLSLLCIAVNMPFPFIPIQITLVDAAMEAWPSFLTIFESDTRKLRGRFLETAVAQAAPFAFVITSMLMFVRLFLTFEGGQEQTVMYLLLIITTMAAVIRSCIPFTKLRAFICVSMVVGTFGGLFVLHNLFEVAAVTSSMAVSTLFVFAMGMVILALLLIGMRRLERP